MKVTLKFFALSLFALSLLGFLSVVPAFGATVTWDGGGDGTQWTDPQNWDSNTVPKAGDNVVIPPLDGSSAVTFSGTLDLSSLQCARPLMLAESASLRVTSGASSIQGVVTLESNNAILSADNAGTTLTLTALTIDGIVVNGSRSELQASAGALITLSATTMTLVDNQRLFLTASGSGSQLNFSTVTSLSLANNAHLQLNAFEGGLIDLPSAAKPDAGKIGLTSSGTGSVIDLSTFSGELLFPAGPLDGQWWVYGDGSVLTGPLTSLSLSFLYLNHPGTFDLSSLASFTGHLQVAGGTESFPSLTTISGGVTVREGAQAAFPALTAITLDETQSLSLYASDPGSSIDLSAVTSLNFAAAKTFLELTAFDGALIDLKQASNPSNGEVRLSGYGTNSVIDLSGFSGDLLFPEIPEGDPGPGSQWWVYKGARVVTGPLKNLGLTLLYLEYPGTLDLSTLTSFTGELQIVEGVLSFPSLTTLAGDVSVSLAAQVSFPAVTSLVGSVWLFSGAQVSFPGLTTITLGDFQSLSLSAWSSGSVLDFPGVTSLNLSSHAHLQFDASYGGAIHLKNALQPTTGEIGLISYGAGSVIDLSAFSGDLTLSSAWKGSDWLISDEGNVLLGTLTGLSLSSLALEEPGTFNLADLNQFRGSLAVSYSSQSFPVLTQLHGSVYAYAGAQIGFPAWTTVSLGENEVLSLRSEYDNSMIDLSAVRTIESTPSSELALTSAFTGKIDMKKALTPQAGLVSLTANQSGTVDVSSMQEGCLPIEPNGSYSIVASNEGQVLIIPYAPPIATASAVGIDQNHSISVPISKLVRSQTDANCAPFLINVPSGSSSKGGTASVDGNAIIYTPPEDFTGEDTISYTVLDRYGEAAEGTIEVTVRGLTGESNTVAIRALSNGHLLITFAGLPNTAYHVQVSSDLIQWIPLAGPLLTGPNGLLEFEDDLELSLPGDHRFYSLIP